MTRLFLVIPLLAGLLLGGCDVTTLTDALTMKVSNPVTTTNIFQAKNVYAASERVIVRYREYCWSKPYAVLAAEPVPVCKNRRPIVRRMQAAKRVAKQAITTAENFVRDHPTLDATDVVRAALAAVTSFQNVTTAAAAGQQ